jgi:hypothetical protein
MRCATENRDLDSAGVWSLIFFEVRSSDERKSNLTVI